MKLASLLSLNSSHISSGDAILSLPSSVRETPRVDAGLRVVGLDDPDVGAGVILDQLMFHPPLKALIPNDWEPALRFTVCDTEV